jgi:hypothetical protein
MSSSDVMACRIAKNPPLMLLMYTFVKKLHKHKYYIKSGKQILLQYISKLFKRAKEEFNELLNCNIL